ncbi:hypothetical protein AAFX91_39195 [Bradyrhizobium sp. 31Argb]|uniref:hypothetical protein n=1 Tax=Bradyrhizobium sp. 31Argb TaxID=3141247 RepID=UPI0037484698
MTTAKTGPERVAELLTDAKITSAEREKIMESLFFKDGVLKSFYAEPLINSMTVKEFDEFLKKAGSDLRILRGEWHNWIWDRNQQRCVEYSGGVCYWP